MVKIQIPPARPEPNFLFGGGAYDGAIFVCGPGLPHYPPSQLVLHEEVERNGTTRAYSYRFAGFDSEGRGQFKFRGETVIATDNDSQEVFD